MTLTDNLKPLLLTLLIAFAAAMKCGEAQAGNLQTVTVAGGCFWCVEADFEKVSGVTGAISGYTGGSVDNPTYKQVTRGGTGHFEAVQITFDPAIISRKRLLALFLRSVDPTDSGGQFCDRGHSYKTAIFVSNNEENRIAEEVKAAAESALGKPIVTPILPLEAFFPAEAYHQDYYKGSKLVFTRFGLIRQSEAYERYREACGRDARVRQLWGDDAAFAGS